jgi:ATP/maltotriose-dependent transcriptional regulator MalT
MEATRQRLLVGRRRELGALAGALERIGAGSPSWVWVHGEPGIGKTRLLDELCARADAAGHLVLAGRGAEFERDIPFGVWVDALDDYAGALGPERVARLVGERVGELSRVLPAVRAPAGAPSAALHDERYRAHRAVRALLDALARQRPVVVVLDDLHWADEASLELVAHVLRRPPRGAVLLALGFRDGQVPAALLGALEAATREGAAVELAPAPLTEREADALLGDSVEAGVRAEAYRQSGGNPFYLEQLVRAGGPVPSGVAASLAQEVAALPERARTLAQGAAVAGHPIELDLAVRAAGLDEREALGALDALLGAGLVRPTDVPRRYGFRHPIVRRAVYDSAPESWRLGAHARALQALEGGDDTLPARAHHLERCARPGDLEAVGVLARAAATVSARAPASAARWLEAALRLLPAGPEGEARRLELLVPLAVARAAGGALEEALDTLEQALARVPPALAELRAGLVAACAASENLLGRHAAAHARLLRALEELGDLDAAAAAVLQTELAADALYEGDVAAMRSWAARAHEAARGTTDPGLSAKAAALRCFAAYNAGAVHEAEALRAEAARGVDALPDEVLAARLEAPYYLGFAELFCERYDDAQRHLRRGIGLARATGQGQFLVPMVIGLAHTLETRGRVRESVEEADAAVEAARLGANPQVLAWALTAQAWTSVMAGERERGLAAGEEAVRVIEGLDDSILTRATREHVGAACLEAGETERGFALLQRAGAPDFPLVEPGRRAWLYAGMARAELARGRAAAAERWLARGEAALVGLELPMAESAVLQARAALLLAEGEAGEAARLALRAAECAGSVEAQVQAARSRTLAGRALAAAGDPARATAELERAEAELSACGALALRDEAARELRRLGHRVPTRGRRGTGSDGLAALSGREREIALLVAQGRTNREIGGELFLSPKTVESHLTHVFAKLGVASRAEVAEAVGRAREGAGAGV